MAVRYLFKAETVKTVSAFSLLSFLPTSGKMIKFNYSL